MTSVSRSRLLPLVLLGSDRLERGVLLYLFLGLSSLYPCNFIAVCSIIAIGP